jgi:flagellar hook-length control protein FliK
MPQADGTVVQQAVAASVADTAVTLNSSRSAMAADGPLKGQSADSTALEVLPKGNETQQASQKEPDNTAPSISTLSSQQVLAIAEQQNLAVESSTVSTERGTAPSDQNGSVSAADAPVSGSPGPGKGGAEVSTTASSGVEATAQQQQVVPLFRSASLEVALAESAPRNEARTTGQAQDVLSAQNTPVAEIPAASTAKTAQTEPQQDVHPAKSGVMPVQVAPLPASSQEPDQAVPANYHALEETRSGQAAVVPAGKTGLEAGGEAVQSQPENAAAAKPVQSIAVEAVKFAGAGSSEGEFSMGDDKGTADNFMNGQFHAALMHQQGNTDGASVSGNVSTPVQNDVQQSGLSEQILQQVRDRLVNHDLKAGNDQIVLRLSPENLGDLKLNLSMDGQRLKIEIVAENHMVRDALLQNAGSLKESLARQNIRMESFDVSTGGRGAGNPGQGQQQSDWRGLAQQKQQNAWMSSGGYRLSDAATVPSQLAYQTPSQHAMVDVHF